MLGIAVSPEQICFVLLHFAKTESHSTEFLFRANDIPSVRDSNETNLL